MSFLATPSTDFNSATGEFEPGTMKHEKEVETDLVRKAVMTIEQRMSEAMDGIEFGTASPVKLSSTSSAETSARESGCATPRSQLTIAPCPARLRSCLPPKNFGAVESGTIYRSGFPEAHNVEFLEQLDLRTVLTLVETEVEPELQIFTGLYDINHVIIPITANKEGEVRTTHASLCEAILVAMNPMNYPLHIHCNRGKHRTGCIVACLRKIQRWPIEEVLAEYDTYAFPKARPEDIELIKNFDPAIVYEYAKKNDMVEGWPRESRVDSATDIWELAAALPPHFLTPSTLSDVSVDEEIDMGGASIDPTNLTYSLQIDTTKPMSPETGDGSPEISIAEVDEDVEMD